MFTRSLRLYTYRVRRQISEDLKRYTCKTSVVQKCDNLNIKPKQAIKEEKVNLVQNCHRSLCTFTATRASLAATTTAVSKDESREFMAFFPDIVRDLTDAGRHTDVPEITRWFAKILQYNVPSGKKNRGLAVVFSYRMLEKPEKLTTENIALANIMGWCVEMLQAFFLITDDVMDGATMRRGVPCWYKSKDVGLSAFNDAIMIENGIYSILRKYFQNHRCYLPVMEIFHDITLKTSMGQTLDVHSQHLGKPNLETFTMDRYNSIVKYKTAYYSFQLPVALAMYLANMHEPELHRQAKTILLEMGHFFQVQDDFLDCYGNPKITGKDCTDIREGKCTWLAVVALQRATPQQKEILNQCYGKNDNESVKTVVEIYEELGLRNMFAIYEEETYSLIRTHIQQLSRGLPHKLFNTFLEKIYRRNS